MLLCYRAKLKSFRCFLFFIFKTFSKNKDKSPGYLGSFFMHLIMSFYKENRPKQKRFYCSKKWLRLRDKYLKEHPLCERCLSIGVGIPSEHVHHKIELDDEKVDIPEIALNEDNLEALCHDCHTREHHCLPEVANDLYFDENGNLRQKSEALEGGYQGSK